MLDIVGPRYSIQTYGVDATTERFFKDMVTLFATMLEKSELYLAVRGGAVFWSTITAQLDSTNPISSGGITNIVRCYVKARRAYSPPQGNTMTNELTDAVDQWIDIETECQSLPSREMFQIAFQTDTSIATDAPDTFEGAASRPKVWPPAHLSPAEREMIMDSKIRPLVEGRCIETPGGLLPLPTKTSTPATVRAFITSLALENHEPRQPWRIGLASLGSFLRPASKTHWASVTGGETNLMWPPSAFARFADAALKGPGVHVAIGLLTP